MNDEPFFIIGVPRSGTTLLRLMLNSHSRIHIPAESKFIVPVYKKYKKYENSVPRECWDEIIGFMEAIGAEDGFPFYGKDVKKAVMERGVISLADFIKLPFRVSSERADKSRWGDKTPGYVSYIEILDHLFPGCQIIHMIRDGRDVAVSTIPLEWGPNTIFGAARCWKRLLVEGQLAGKKLGEKRYIEVKYENLVANPVAVLEEVVDFLGEKYDKKMLAYHKSVELEKSTVNKSWHKLVKSAPVVSRVGRYSQKLSAARISAFEFVAGKELQKNGYSVGVISNQMRIRFVYLLYLISRAPKYLITILKKERKKISKVQ